MIEQPDKERWKDVVGYEGLYQDGSTIERYKSMSGAARSNKIDVQMLHSIIRKEESLMDISG